MPTPRFLVADDNPLSLRFFAEALGALGIDCAEASDGAIALELAGREAFALLLLDARMPRGGGIEVLAGIRARPGPSQAATALATTATPDAAAQAQLRAAGFADVLIKPLGVEALRAALCRYLPQRLAHGIAENRGEWLDDGHALAVAGGDTTIVCTLRRLLLDELERLPDELAAAAAHRDARALHERLHRLDASAGFCGVPMLARAASMLRVALDGRTWPAAALTRFLQTCDSVRMLLERSASAGTVPGDGT